MYLEALLLKNCKSTPCTELKFFSGTHHVWKVARSEERPELDFHLTQILSGGECWEKGFGYMFLLQHRRYTRAHPIKVPEMEIERKKVRVTFESDIIHDNIVNIMLEVKKEWKIIKKLANYIMRATEKKKEIEEGETSE